MIKVEELQKLALFACLDDAELRRLAEKAADVRLQKHEWLVKEGDLAYFYVVLEGRMQMYKEVVGQDQQLAHIKPGDFFGEVPVILGAPSLVSLQAVEDVRVARFDPQQLRELIHSSAACGAIILQAMMERLKGIPDFARRAPSSRVHMVGTQYDTDCRDIRTFLTLNRIPYEWIDRDRDADLVPHCALSAAAVSRGEAAVVIDKTYCVEEPVTVRKVAQALGIRTRPLHDSYDVVIVGAGPAGMTAGVYGASEGLKVLMVEKSAAGGQAGTSSRIENYLGFPNGISGDELTERALKQAGKFGAEIAMTRTVTSIVPLENNKYCVELDNEDGTGSERVSTCVVVLATGVEWRMLQAEGVAALQGRGVLYGASRDEAVNVVGKHVFIVGGGNSAGQAAVFFANYAAHVTVLVRGAGLELTMSQYLIGQIDHKQNITIEPYTEVVRAEGDEHLERIVTRTLVPGGEACLQTREADALFVMIGATANTAWMPAELERDAKGYICTGRDLTDWALEREPFPLETSLPGIFCAGDVRHESIKRVSSGVGEGSMAVAFIHQYLALQNF